ncbi:Uncharacterised protein [Serratia proteamaculans]|uniref:hypothetical protein n=1 Tax=Serratia proteamaculans TaxID=28151 RepID=UPI00218402FC|nr:hypothetical protein [Serratia proteamaculans]CAI2537724.1 Uncharacterised protein [Serratia proteamaculans]
MKISALNKSTVLGCAALAVIVLLNGCQNQKKNTTKPAAKVQAVDPRAEMEAQRLQQCQRDLEALSSLKTESYTQSKQAFDRLMSGAAQYANLRTRVNTETQDTVDALYRYRVNLLCAQINQAVLSSLAERGEALR